jgi:hypothetical protein
MCGEVHHYAIWHPSNRPSLRKGWTATSPFHVYTFESFEQVRILRELYETGSCPSICVYLR